MNSCERAHLICISISKERHKFHKFPHTQNTRKIQIHLIIIKSKFQIQIPVEYFQMFHFIFLPPPLGPSAQIMQISMQIRWRYLEPKRHFNRIQSNPIQFQGHYKPRFAIGGRWMLIGPARPISDRGANSNPSSLNFNAIQFNISIIIESPAAFVATAPTRGNIITINNNKAKEIVVILPETTEKRQFFFVRVCCLVIILFY